MQSDTNFANASSIGLSNSSAANYIVKTFLCPSDTARDATGRVGALKYPPFGTGIGPGWLSATGHELQGVQRHELALGSAEVADPSGRPG